MGNIQLVEQQGLDAVNMGRHQALARSESKGDGGYTY
jgi:hypothetical protein